MVCSECVAFAACWLHGALLGLALTLCNVNKQPPWCYYCVEAASQCRDVLRVCVYLLFTPFTSCPVDVPQICIRGQCCIYNVYIKGCCRCWRDSCASSCRLFGTHVRPFSSFLDSRSSFVLCLSGVNLVACPRLHLVRSHPTFTTY